MQDDGNIVILDEDNKERSGYGTEKKENKQKRLELVVQNDSNLVLYRCKSTDECEGREDRTAMWSTNTAKELCTSQFQLIQLIFRVAIFKSKFINVVRIWQVYLLDYTYRFVLAIKYFDRLSGCFQQFVC